MHLKTLLAAAALASSTTAFLVPLEVAKAVKTVEDNFHLSLIDQKSRSIALECPGCYFDTANDRQDDYFEDPENSLGLNFTINDESNALALNGQKIYPLEFPYPLDLYAPLVRSANGLESPPVHLGFALEYLPFHDGPEGTMVPIRLSIVDLDGVAVRVPTVMIDVIKMQTQELLIAKVDTIPFEETPGQECRNAFCRAKAIALSHLHEMMEGARSRAGKAGKKLGLKGCGGRKPEMEHKGHRQHKGHKEHKGEMEHKGHKGVPRPPMPFDGERFEDGPFEGRPFEGRPTEGFPDEDELFEDRPGFEDNQSDEERPSGDGPFGDRPVGGKKLPGHRRPPHGMHGHGQHEHRHHHHHHHHGMHKLVHRAMHLFIIPALLGVIGGLTASAIGMFVGQSIVFLWFRFVRKGKKGAARRAEAASDEEKEALVDSEDEEAPPVYENYKDEKQ